MTDSVTDCKTCKECNNEYYEYGWCNNCYAKRFQQDFENWTSGNDVVDKFIQGNQLKATSFTTFIEWIPFEKFKDVTYLSKGGFGSVSKAVWPEGYIIGWNKELIRIPNVNVCLKRLDNSANISPEFLQEVQNQLKLRATSATVPVYGLSRDPVSNDYVIVTSYSEYQSLRDMTVKSYDKFDCHTKMKDLFYLTKCLSEIHEAGLVHGNLHPGNVICYGKANLCLSDLGLNKPASDKRPTAKELVNAYDQWNTSKVCYDYGETTELHYQIEETKLLYMKQEYPIYDSANVKVHPQALYTSRPLSIHSS
ncbi:3190_t:CDS:2 [Acaulospora morrowiae]|uniref:3190_t:CDS:1 n=1 Tax=Acaulospora morrowiae TaxID=94023 RepID=A0A9N8ZMV2_9GLOM|nr:3190_t:CDS:2 [Acaulospora morrowiae]